MHYFTHKDITDLAYNASCKLPVESKKVYAIPRGGVLAAYAIANFSALEFVPLEEADYIIDDIYDTGATMDQHLTRAKVGAKPILLVDKREQFKDQWVVFPWEQDPITLTTEGIEENIKRILQFVGEDPSRGGLIETPARVSKAWREWTRGYTQDPKDILKMFDDGAENYDEMIVSKNISFVSHCEHHLAPFMGTVTVGYVPKDRIVGLSKINRLVDCFARRLQVQERMTTQIADAIEEHLKPLGVGVIVQARHLCIESRGINQPGSITTTSALKGALRDPHARREFLSLAK